MNFSCFYCGKTFEIYNIRRIKVFCCRVCNDTVHRLKLFTSKEIAAERERRTEAYRNRVKQEPQGLRVKCIICGKEITQVSSSPKMYCSSECRTVQGHQHLYTRQEIHLEKERRKQAFIDALTPEHRKVIEYGRQKRFEFCEREDERGGDDGALQPTRHCHNYFTKVHCPNLTWDYYCPECRKKKRQGYVEEDYSETEDVWDDFSVPSPEEA